MAVPTVLMMLLAAAAMVGVGVNATVSAQQGVSRDAETKAALPAAEAGVSQAILHYNRIPTTQATPCVVATGSDVTLQPATNGWCAESVGTMNGRTFSYRVKPTAGELEIVSTGTSDGLTRRVEVTAVSSSGQGVFRDATVKAQDWLDLAANSEILTGSATNGDITMSSNARICGSGSVGLGHQMSVSGNAVWYDNYSPPNCVTPNDPGTVPQAPLTLAPVNQGDAATNNDNDRFFGLDLIAGKATNACFDGLRGDGTAGTCGARHLDLSSNTSITLGGGTYSFCRLTMSSNTNLFVASGATVNMYFDSPENCGLAAGTKQLELDSNSRITSSSGGATNVAMLFVGSPTMATQINLASNTQVSGDCEQNYVIYAPRTDILINSNSTYCGALAGKTIRTDSNAKIYADSLSQNWTLPGAPPHYVASGFVECTGTSSSSPDQGC